MPTVGLTPSDVLTIGGASVVVNIVVFALLKLFAWTAAQKDRFGAILAIGAGFIVVGGFALVQHADIASAALTGILAGAASIGIYDTATSVIPSGSTTP